jgi:hypothetical protein
LPQREDKKFHCTFQAMPERLSSATAREQFGMKIAFIFGEERGTSGERVDLLPCPSGKSAAV